VHLKLN